MTEFRKALYKFVEDLQATHLTENHKLVNIHTIEDQKEKLIFPSEFNHTLKVLEMGAVKYGPNSWLKGLHFDIHKNHKSMAHHLLESYREIREDHESGLDPLLHLATRALMEYTLRSRGKIDKDGKVK